MSHRLVLFPEAKQDLRQAADWYDAQSEGRGKLFLDAVSDQLDFVLRNPQIFAPVYRNARLAQVDPYPYVICFKVESQMIVVFAIVHTSRDPAIWQRRVP